jgi:hypothetical protein
MARNARWMVRLEAIDAEMTDFGVYAVRPAKESSRTNSMTDVFNERGWARGRRTLAV